MYQCSTVKEVLKSWIGAVTVSLKLDQLELHQRMLYKRGALCGWCTLKLRITPRMPDPVIIWEFHPGIMKPNVCAAFLAKEAITWITHVHHVIAGHSAKNILNLRNSQTVYSHLISAEWVCFD